MTDVFPFVLVNSQATVSNEQEKWIMSMHSVCLCYVENLANNHNTIID